MEPLSRYIIGIDLGTTNSALAYIDTAESATEGVASGIRILEIAQLTGPGEVRTAPLLPSFLYFPTEDEISSGSVSLPWEERPSAIAGVMARDRGALTSGRQVTSAKSWLCQGAIDRTASILPREADPSEAMVSPVEASSLYLAHLRQAWDQVIGGEPANSQDIFENQQIVLTVPASFDEEARELTVQAARQAGIKNLTLLEEPLAAFYSWVAQYPTNLSQQLHDEELVLICDIGGGTSDFSLVRAPFQDGRVEFERTAIGEHLLLGGENLDLALAHRVEQKIGAKLTLRQRHALRVSCMSAKEHLLANPHVDRVPINVLGGGRSVVGQMLSSELTRDEVVDFITDSFLPLTSRDELPQPRRAAGLREIGLPYTADPAITRHLAAFLKQSALAMGLRQASGQQPILARPDSILFNGGFCIPALVRERIAEAVGNWFDCGAGWRPRILDNELMSSAVAIGAAYYGRAKRGNGLRIKAGSPRTFYVGIRSEQSDKAVCVLPAGTNEGTTLPLTEREFSVLANRPVSFHLYSSTIRHDTHGAFVELDAAKFHSHAPLVTLLRYGKKLQQTELAIRLLVTFTEVGTLELWCESLTSPHRWRLQFDLRHETSAAEQAAAKPLPASRQGPRIANSARESALPLIRDAFTRSTSLEHDQADPASLVANLESVTGLKRDSWPLATLRLFCDALTDVAEGRKLSPRHEVRWLNLFGFCLRPGFGDRDDSSRIAQARRIYQAGLSFPRELQCQVDWLLLWRRIAGGIATAHQGEIRKYVEGLGIVRKKSGSRLNPQVEHDGWRLLASLEHVAATTRASFGAELLRKLKKEPSDSGWLWSLGRLGARIPLYGSLNCVVSAARAAEWITTLLDIGELTRETAFAVVQMGRRVNDPNRDITSDVIQSAIAKLKLAGVADESTLRPLLEYIAPSRSDVARNFGESLPKDMELESTASCLSSITALTA